MAPLNPGVYSISSGLYARLTYDSIGGNINIRDGHAGTLSLLDLLLIAGATL